MPRCRDNRSRRLRRRRRNELVIALRREEADRNCWLCQCGNWIEDGLHCMECLAEPPWGCPCCFCDERYDDDFEEPDEFDAYFDDPDCFPENDKEDLDDED